jgi:hypothetical protein
MEFTAGLGRVVGCVGVALALGGCAATGPGPGLDQTEYAHKATRGQVQLYWNCERPEPGLLVVAGYAVSPYTSPVQDLKFRLEGVDAGRVPVSQATGAAQTYLIHLMERDPFRVALRTTGTEVRFDLTYTYVAKETGGGQNDSGGPIEHSLVARDVCPTGK